MHEILLKSLNIKSQDSPTTKKKKSLVIIFTVEYAIT